MEPVWSSIELQKGGVFCDNRFSQKNNSGPWVENNSDFGTKTKVVLSEVNIMDPNRTNSEVVRATEKMTNGLSALLLKDQWTIENPTGRKHYGRGFLLRLRYTKKCTQKPNDLPCLPEIILDMPYDPRKEQPVRSEFSSKPMMDFTPNYYRGSSSGNKATMSPRNGQPIRGQGKVIKLQTKVELNRTQNAWKPSHKTTESIEKDEEIFRKIKSILNKLTPQKFQTLVKQIIDLGITTETRLRGAIEIIFEKAISEPSFSVAYANMCRHMINLRAVCETRPGEVLFKNLLLNRCQKEFEKEKADEAAIEKKRKEIQEAPKEKQPELMEEFEAEQKKSKRRSLGNIRFIGELFKLKILTEKIIHDCLFKLLNTSDEEDLECLCGLLRTTGKEVDNQKARARVDQYFARMEKMSKQTTISSRVRFMVRDILELRQNNWVPRREDKGPKTIEQVHRDAEQEMLTKQAELQRASLEAPKRLGRSPAPGNQSTDSWQTKPVRAAPMDPNKMRITKTMGGNVQLGPGGRPGSWARGSSGGSKSGSQEFNKPQTPKNRFAMLSADSASDENNRESKPYNHTQRGGRTTPRNSQELDRAPQLANSRNMGRNPAGSRVRSQELNRDQPRDGQRPPVVPSPAKELSPEQIEKKTKSLIEEYLEVVDIKEAELCVRELQSPNNLHLFVSTTLNIVLEKSQKARQLIAKLMARLIRNQAITVEHYLKGVKEVLQFAEDIAIDIPQFWVYMAELVGPMMDDDTLPLKSLYSLTEPLLPIKKAGLLVAKVLHNIAERLGHAKVGQLWQASQMKWEPFLNSQDLTGFIKQNGLEFTLPCDAEVTGQFLNLEHISAELEKLLKTAPCNEEVLDWITDNVPKEVSKHPRFARSLMTVICNSAIMVRTNGTRTVAVDKKVIPERSDLLLYYLDRCPDRELQALYAVQAVVHSKDHPAGVLRALFDGLYDEDIISEDTFFKWESSVDPAEAAGRGVARTSVTQFFTWLREADCDEQQQT